MPLDNTFSWRWPAVLQYPSQHYNTYIQNSFPRKFALPVFPASLFARSVRQLFYRRWPTALQYSALIYNRRNTVLSAYTTHSSLSLRWCYTGRFLSNTVLQQSCPKNLCCKSSRVKSPLQKTDQSNNYIPPAITISYRAKTTNLVNPHVWRRLGVTGVAEETIIFYDGDEIFLILSSARAWARVILAGKRDILRYSTAGYSKTVVG